MKRLPGTHFTAGMSVVLLLLNGCVAPERNVSSSRVKAPSGYVQTSPKGTATHPATRPEEQPSTTDGAQDIGAILDRVVAQRSVPGLAAVVLRGDRIIALGVGGVRKSGAPERITIQDQFLLCSGTKAMTATLAALAVEKRMLSWTTTVGEVFLASGAKLHPEWASATLAQLLNHRAGAPNDTAYLWKILRLHFFSQGSPSEKRRLLVGHVLSHPPAYSPGSRFLYTSLDYFVVAAMLEKVTGQSWEDLIQERLWQPLGITTGGFGTPGTRSKVDQPWGHWGGIDSVFYRPGHPVAPGSLWGQLGGEPFYAPAGTAHMTITDWAKFIALHLRGDPANPRRSEALLSSGSFATLHACGQIIENDSGLPAASSSLISQMPGSQTQSGYEFGWFFERQTWANGGRPGDIGRVLRSLGDSGWVHVDALFAPEIDFAVLVICNQGGVDNRPAAMACNDAASELINEFAPTIGKRAKEDVPLN